MVNAVVNNIPLEPYVATFEDGYRADVVCESMIVSSETGKKVICKYE